MARTTDVPGNGMLAGLKVLGMTKAVASSVALNTFAEHGATVINVEPIGGEALRTLKYAWNQEHRNQLALGMDMRKEGGRELFLKLIEWADIWIEASKGTMFESWGVTDEYLWEHNPKLTILHVSGFGHEGVDEYVNRASYDAIGQAFGGFMYINGEPDPQPPLRGPNTCDEITGLYGAMATLAGYVAAQKTGKGESIDLAQFEPMIRVQLNYPMLYLNDGKLLSRSGNEDPSFQGYNAYKCKNNEWCFVGVSGPNIIARAKGFFGLADDPDFPDGLGLAYRGTPAGTKLEAAIVDYCAQHTKEEVQADMMELGVPCCPVYNIAELSENEHYQAREVFTEWEDPQYGTVKGVNIMPKVKVHEPTIWRGAPLVAQDSYDILQEFGYTDEQIAALEQAGTVQIAKEQA